MCFFITHVKYHYVYSEFREKNIEKFDETWWLYSLSLSRNKLNLVRGQLRYVTFICACFMVLFISGAGVLKELLPKYDMDNAK